MAGSLVDVVAVANAADPHLRAVSDELARIGKTVVRVNLSDLRSYLLTAEPGQVRLCDGDVSYSVSSATSVWWRQPGAAATGGLGPAEALLAIDEAPHLFVGALGAAAVRFVDDPFVMARAEVKQIQLASAYRLGIRIPDTVVTNDPVAAGSFASGRRVVAKAVSSGIGIAPFAGEVFDDELYSVRTMPTLLQELVPATADLRVVVVAGESWAWRRPREPGTIDWRQVDPPGRDFERSADRGLADLAHAIAGDLGLSMSVQDWLEVDGDPVFLESNSQGAWLFLAHARSLIAPAIARHLGAIHDG
jgi:hypothetical protein